MGLLIVGTQLSGCATNSAPAPVEQRRPTSEATRTPPADLRAQGAPTEARRGEPARTQVQVTGLGDDPTKRTAQPEDAMPVTEATRSTPIVASPPQAAGRTAHLPAAQDNSLADEPTGGFAVANPAVVALLNRANRDAAAGRHGASAASLERAIKIEPGNAWLWHRLAQIRLKQNQPGAAASIAARSNSLAGNDNALRARNWRLIASVHRLRGELAAAQAAQREAERLEQETS